MALKYCALSIVTLYPLTQLHVKGNKELWSAFDHNWIAKKFRDEAKDTFGAAWEKIAWENLKLGRCWRSGEYTSVGTPLSKPVFGNGRCHTHEPTSV